jgi:predicted small lipoprotein YifL
MPYSTAVMLLALCIAPLSGCGQMGPLYMPTPEPVGTEVLEDAAVIPPATQEP